LVVPSVLVMDGMLMVMGDLSVIAIILDVNW